MNTFHEHIPRNRWTKFAAILAGLGPIVLLGFVGFLFLQPRSRPSVEWIALTPLESLPESGLPIRLLVCVPGRDSWTQLPDRPVGAVYARRKPQTSEVTALSAVHGKFRVPVLYDSSENCFQSQCFGVRFDAAGKVLPNDLIQPSPFEELQSISAKVEDGVVLVQWPHE